MKYRYLYQDKANRNLSGEIEARNRADAYAKLRKAGIRPYRVIGDDPFDWRPLAFWTAICIALASLVYAGVVTARYVDAPRAGFAALTPAEAAAFRARAEEAVFRAPDSCRYNVWCGVNARLKERGLKPIPRPDGLTEENSLLFE